MGISTSEQEAPVVSIGHSGVLLGSFLHTGVYSDYTSSSGIHHSFLLARLTYLCTYNAGSHPNAGQLLGKFVFSFLYFKKSKHASKL